MARPITLRPLLAKRADRRTERGSIFDMVGGQQIPQEDWQWNQLEFVFSTQNTDEMTIREIAQ